MPGRARGADGQAGTSPTTADGGGSRELIRDPRFQRGFHLLAPKPGQREVTGALSGAGSDAPPIWDLAQWSSRFPLTPAAPGTPAPGARRWANDAKAVTVGAPESALADLALAVNGSVEYGTRARKSDEPWVHLLVEQSFAGPPSLAGLKSARLRLEARLLRADFHRTPDYSPGLHAAQFQLFLTVQNRNRESAGYGKYLWFGVPLYDDRSRIPPAHKAKDTAGSSMFIYTPAGEVFTQHSAHDRQWIRVDKELRPLLVEALESAWERGFLRESRDLGDYRVTGMNLGWEVPGIFDVEMQTRGLSLQTRLS